MRIEVKKPLDCPLRELDGSVITCSVVKATELVCDNELTDDFPFPPNCPLAEDGIISIVKER